jgi:hypothetical protein
MIHAIKTSKASKVIASYLAIQLLVTTVQPSQLFALTSGPSQPEFNAFTPIGTSDMVNLSTGDFNYNIPIMDVGGYPLNLAYNSGITMDQEASWVGLGWNLNVGQIARNVRGIPDDFKGDEMRYENDMKENITIGTSVGITGALFGVDVLKGSIGLGVEYNNYNGYTFTPSLGVSYALNKTNAAFGLNISSATGEGASLTPSVSLTSKGQENTHNYINSINGNFGLGINSRQGVSNLNLSFTNNRTKQEYIRMAIDGSVRRVGTSGAGGGGAGGAISFNDLTNYTPTKRVSMNNDSKTFNLSLGSTVLGGQLQGQISGYGSYQQINTFDKDKFEPAFGYENTQFAEGGRGILDFNREKDNTVNKFTTVLPITNYAYDIYAIQGQGAGGTFRPFRSQVSYVYDNTVTDTGTGATFGAELGFGNLWYAGAEVKITTTKNRTGKWSNQNYALNNFIEKNSDINPIDYEKAYFKQMGELIVDQEYDNIYQGLIHEEAPMRLAVSGSQFNKSLQSKFLVKANQSGAVNYTEATLNSTIKRTKRELRNNALQKITNEEAELDEFVQNHSLAKKHHTVGIKSFMPDGSTYVFGEAAYNIEKVEATFDVSRSLEDNEPSNDPNCSTGLIGYNGSVFGNSSANSNQFLNRITTPAYAHTYLLTSVLSSDYEDISQDGPTDDDLGAYTKFNYEMASGNYQWRIPFEENKVTYNEGLKSDIEDEIGNYIYGKKELKYISSIETKTHVAVFQLIDRHDSRGVKGESGGMGVNNASSKMKMIDKIYLYSKPEYKKLVENTSFDLISPEEKAKAAIKIAHFEYDYSLCPNIINNDNGNYDGNGDGVYDDNQGGKLTLKKLYFTYHGSNMGKYTPYVFNYRGFTNVDGDFVDEANEPYHINDYDIWGNYKENNTGASCSVESAIANAEFPFVEQDQETADRNARMWTLSSIDLPSGGRLELETESDDYQYVQDRETMSMLKVAGIGNNPINDVQAIIAGSETFNSLYNGVNDHNNFLYIKLPFVTNNEDFINKYIGDQINKPIYFRFLLNMDQDNPETYDYVTGYFEIDENIAPSVINGYGIIPLRTLDKEGGFVSNNKQVNPIAKAGWHFGRTYLNRLVYTGEQRTDVSNFEDAVQGIWDALGGVQEIFTGPNQKLEQLGCAKLFNPEKSWIRLKHVSENGDKVKLGGGLRVKRIVLHDRFDDMVGSPENPGPIRYRQHYGQEYSYLNEDNLSSGVASFEPNGSKENPFVEPFYGNESTNYRDRMVSPNHANYVEKPFGETFFPAPIVTYGRVEVKNLQRERTDGNTTLVVKKHATGSVVNEFYTTKNFPTLVNFTDINSDGLDQDPKALGLFNLSARNYMTLSQGFSIVTNDMNGKQKSQRIYGEGQAEAISGVDYFYNVDKIDPKRLNNEFVTIDEKGVVTKNIIGQTYDVVNDFRENYSETEVGGVNSNLTSFLAAIFPGIVPFPLPTYANHKNILRTAVTTKIIHKTGVLVEKVAYDVGASVSTKNIAWDAKTGQVLLTKTVNEYDNAYYNFTYPAYWYYEGMGMASINIGMEGVLEPADYDETGRFIVTYLDDETSASEIFHLGDMLQTSEVGNEEDKQILWVVEIPSDTDEEIKLMDAQGYIINEKCSPSVKGVLRYKIIRSGYRNMQMASMSSITSQINPIDIDNDGQYNPLSNSISKVVNASAVMYNDFWKPQDQLGLPRLTPTVLTEFNKATDNSTATNPNIDVASYGFNPYLYNARGEWRAVESYAYLGGRTSSIATPGDSPSLSNDGYFSFLSPFYRLNTSNNWEIKASAWTSASTVTQYSPYGAELENRDALGRYSSAVYGYGYTLPTAVASNSEYKETTFVGFEDEDTNNVLKTNSAIIDENEAIFVRDHFSFNTLTDDTQGNGIITKEASHTGTKSFKVTGGQAKVTKGLTPNQHTVKYSCYDSDGQYGVDGFTYVTDNGLIPGDQETIIGEGSNYYSYKYEDRINISRLSSSQDNLEEDIRIIAVSEFISTGDDAVECKVFAEPGGDGYDFIDHSRNGVGLYAQSLFQTTIKFDGDGKAFFNFSLEYIVPDTAGTNDGVRNTLTFYFLDKVGRERAERLQVILTRYN